MAAVGGRAFRHKVGPVSLLTYRLGPKEGEPWVLLHGMGSTALSWRAVARALKKECAVWIPELSALGGTRAPGGGLNVKEGVEVVADLIRTECGDRPVTVGGISLGGWMATRLALSYPELVGRLLLVDAAGYRNQDWNRIRSLVDVRKAEDLEPLYDALFHHTPKLLQLARPGFLAAYRSHSVRHAITTIDVQDAYSDDDLARIKVPTGLIWADCDGLFTLDTARAMHAALPLSELYVIAECGHAIQWEQRRKLVDTVGRFRQWTGGAPVATATPAPAAANG